MKKFNDTVLWEVLKTSDSIPATAPVHLDEALDDFIAVLHAFCREERNIAERTRALSDLRSKLATHLEDKLCTSKKCALLRNIIKQAISSIDSELFLVKMDLEHPERFIEFPSDTPPLGRWGGNISELIEYTIGPQVSGKLLMPSGKPMTFEEAIEFLEKTFGITIPYPHDRRAKVFDRQKNTAFQDEMRKTFLAEVERRDH